MRWKSLRTAACVSGVTTAHSSERIGRGRLQTNPASATSNCRRTSP